MQGDQFFAFRKTLLDHKLSKDDLQIILKDVPRTISKPYTKQVVLYHILKCITIQFPEVGYMQGMNFIAAQLLKYNSPEDTFMIMISLY